MHLQNKSYSSSAKIDKGLIFFYLILIFFGLANIYSVSCQKAFKQLIWIVGVFLFLPLVFAIRVVDYKHYTLPFYIVGIFSLIGVLIFGKEINGSRSWYVFGPISFQPVELVKICVSLSLANILSKPDYSLKKKGLLQVFFILFLPMLLILLQPDAGSVLVFASFILLFYRIGLHINFLFILISLIILFLLSINFKAWMILSGFVLIFIFSIPFQKNFKSWFTTFLIFGSCSLCIFFFPFVFDYFLKNHHKDRIEIIFKNEFDPKYRNDVGYNLLYSKTAIGSGGFLGKGYQKGTITKGKFVPEQHTDYIFCTVGEEWGFLGGAILIGIYLLFIARIYLVAERQDQSFSKIFGYALGSLLFGHFFINVGMVMGLFPTVGIPLPFFSYGGSSFLAFSLLFFIFLKLDAQNKREEARRGHYF